MKCLIIYYSYFGNTEEVAKQYAQYLKTETKLIRADEVSENDILSNDIIIIGSPTRAFNMVKPIKKVLKKYKKAFENKLVFAYDTRADIIKVDSKLLTFMVKRFGYAVEKIDRLLIKNKARLIDSGKWYFVLESEGPLYQDTSEKVKEHALELNKTLN
jgi:flavodoxin